MQRCSNNTTEIFLHDMDLVETYGFFFSINLLKVIYVGNLIIPPIRVFAVKCPHALTKRGIK